MNQRQDSVDRSAKAEGTCATQNDQAAFEWGVNAGHAGHRTRAVGGGVLNRMLTACHGATVASLGNVKRSVRSTGGSTTGAGI